MDQVRVLTMSFPLQNALVAVNQQRRYRMPGAQRKDFATMTSSAAAKGKWAAEKGFAERATRGSHMPAAHDPQSSFTAARLIRGFLEHLSATAAVPLSSIIIIFCHGLKQIHL